MMYEFSDEAQCKARRPEDVATPSLYLMLVQGDERNCVHFRFAMPQVDLEYRGSVSVPTVRCFICQIEADKTS